jgi:hypothetical protein
MDYKTELERLKAYLQTEINSINDDDALEDRYARQANKSTLEKVDQILKRGEAEPTNENSGLHLQNVNVRFPSKEQVIEEGERQVNVWLDGNTDRELQHFRVGFRRSFEYVLRCLNAR